MLFAWLPAALNAKIDLEAQLTSMVPIPVIFGQPSHGKTTAAKLICMLVGIRADVGNACVY